MATSTFRPKSCARRPTGQRVTPTSALRPGLPHVPPVTGRSHSACDSIRFLSDRRLADSSSTHLHGAGPSLYGRGRRQTGTRGPPIRPLGRPSGRPHAVPVPIPPTLQPKPQNSSTRRLAPPQVAPHKFAPPRRNTMKTYQGSEIRNVAVVGHAHSGKTTLIAALLHAAKMTPTQGRVEDGTAVTAYDEEEIARGATMQNAVAFAEWQGVKINLVDTPGFHIFTHEARAALLPVESAIVVVNAQHGIEPVSERVWRYADEAGVPRIVLVNQMDHPKAGGGEGLSALIDDLVDRWGRNCVPVQLPISGAEGFRGVVDLVTMEAFYYTPGGDGRGKATAEIPAGLTADAKTRHEALVELVAEGKDELMEEYFETGTLTKEHLIAALHEAVREDRIFPVLFSSGLGNMALDHLLDFIKEYTPSPVERAPIAVRNPSIEVTEDNPDAGKSTRKIDDSGPLALMVFKTMTDPFSGRISFFKVISGVIKNDANLENYTRRGSERFSHLSVMQGRKAVEVLELHAGDLGAVAKLRETLTGDTLGQKGAEIQIDLHKLPEPAMTYAIEPKSRADEDKLAPAIHKLMEEDLLIRFFRDPQTNEFLIAGAGQPHIESIVSRLKKRYHA